MLDVLAVLALGLLITVLLGVVWVVRKRRKSRTLAERVALARSLPEQKRAFALAGMLKEMTDQVAAGAAPWPDRTERAFDLDALSAQQLKLLYQPGAFPDPDAIERAVLSAQRR